MRTSDDTEKRAPVLNGQRRGARVFATFLSHGAVKERELLKDGSVGLADLERGDAILRQVAAACAPTTRSEYCSEWHRSGHIDRVLSNCKVRTVPEERPGTRRP